MHPPPPAAGCGAETCRAQLRSPRLCSIGPYTAVCFKVGSVRVGPRPRQAGSGSRSKDEAGILHLTSPGASHAGRTPRTCVRRNCCPVSARGRCFQTPPPGAARRQLRRTKTGFLPRPDDAKTPPEGKQSRGPGALLGKGVCFSTHLQRFQILPSKIQLSLGVFFFFPL